MTDDWKFVSLYTFGDLAIAEHVDNSTGCYQYNATWANSVDISFDTAEQMPESVVRGMVRCILFFTELAHESGRNEAQKSIRRALGLS
jgi:hypothetical protein